MAVLKHLYFFDQPRRQFKKRARKPVDQLPFSLPFTGVSGTLKVEAYLRQQMKLAEQTSTTTSKDGGTLNSPRDSETTGVSKKGRKVSSSQAGKAANNEVSQDNSVKRTRSKVEKGTVVYDALSLSRQETGEELLDEEEDTQRFLFEENKFAAPNLLARLTRLLEYLDEQQQQSEDNDDVYNERAPEQNWATTAAAAAANSSGHVTSHNANEAMINYFETITSDVRALKVTIPFHLQEKLKWDFDQLVAHTVYQKREWQTSSYKQQAALEKQRKLQAEKIIVEEAAQLDSNTPTPNNNNKSSLSKPDEVSSGPKTTKPRKDRRQSTCESSPTLIKKEPASSSSMVDNGRGSGPAVMVMSPDLPHVHVVSVRRESHDSTANQPRTRLEKYRNLPDKALLVPVDRKKKTGLNQFGRTDDHGADAQGAQLLEGSSMQLPVSSIAFSLMSKQCEEQGWVEHSHTDLERLTIIEWALRRLKEAKTKHIQTGPVLVKKYGETGIKKATDKLVVFQQYGEPQTPVKTKRGKSKIRRTSSGQAKLELFMVAVPDGTMTLYYPSGKIAVCVSKNLVGAGQYTYVYDNYQDSLLAYFTPTNLFCSDKDGKQIFCGPKGGIIYNQDGAVLRKWVWKASKLLPSIYVEFNEYLSLKIVSQNVMTLQYNGQQESHKMSLGLSQDSRSSHANAKGEIKTLTTIFGDASSPTPPQQIKTKTKFKKEEKRARKQSMQVDVEEIQEARREELNKKFPERATLALDLPSDIELYKLKRRIRNIAFEWMERYRLLVGISSPLKVTTMHARRKQTCSAKSLPGALPSAQKLAQTLAQVSSEVEQRAPSAPPIPRTLKIDVSKVTPLGRLTGLAENYKERGPEWLHKDNVPVYLTEVVDKHKVTSGPPSPRPPFRCGLANHEPRCTSPKEGCPVALHLEMLGEKYAFCRCRKREIPFVGDLEYDTFIREQVASSQLVVITVISSRFPGDISGINMLERLYYEKNRNRSFPCAQAKHDPFRIVLYDVDRAAEMDNDACLLVKRHNVVPGMFLMYIGGKLLFADHIFNGYGNERNDFLKQITKCRKDFIQGLFLPANFRLSPTPCRSGLRSAWGGEIGGLSRGLCDTRPSTGTCEPRTMRLPSAVTSLSSESIDYRASGAKSAASFIKLGLSIDSPFGRGIKSKTAPPIRKLPRNV